MNQAIELIEKHIQENAYAGAALVVAQRGNVVFAHYAGNAAPGLPSSPSVLWPVASISKIYSVVAIMRLVEQGVLTTNMPACHLLPKFVGDRREDIRLRHLLTHTSGLIYESTEMEARLMAQTPLSELVAEAYGAPLLFKPGTQFSYADYNTLLASAMASAATGRAFDELVRTLVLEPAGLRDTFFPPPPNEFGRIGKVRAVMAEGTDGAMYNSAYARSLAHPAFGVVATAQDLAQLGLLFAPTGPRLLSSVAMRAMTTDQTGGVPGQHISLNGLPANGRVPWALGFALQTAQVPGVFSEFASDQTFGHGGASGCQVLIDPALDLVIAFTSNTHVRTGREAWYRRMQSIVNVCFVEAVIG